MGLIKAGMGALGGTLADQWKEFFYCDALDKDVLMVKGQKRTSRRSSNNGEDNIITSGSGIAVADGQCMLIVEQGRVVEVCAEPGEFTFDSPPPSPASSPATSATVWRRHSRPWPSALPTAATRARTSGCTTSTPRNWARSCTAPPPPFPSGWWSARSGATSSR